MFDEMMSGRISVWIAIFLGCVTLQRYLFDNQLLFQQQQCGRKFPQQFLAPTWNVSLLFLGVGFCRMICLVQGINPADRGIAVNQP